MSVFTTRSLLASLGVSNRHSGEAAAAINWVLKDGAGRMGRFLFARWGRQLDCELKQFRLGGDILMEAGAALELRCGGGGGCVCVGGGGAVDR